VLACPFQRLEECGLVHAEHVGRTSRKLAIPPGLREPDDDVGIAGEHIRPSGPEVCRDELDIARACAGMALRHTSDDRHHRMMPRQPFEHPGADEAPGADYDDARGAHAGLVRAR
jgi:hypothetical protein